MFEGFTSFVIFAGMRTGSNFLEVNLNAFEGIICHGEAFNPHFIGYPNSKPILGVDLETRDADPMILLDALRNEEDHVLRGFRYFHDHDPRVFDAIMEDRRCAKIILTRGAVDSHVSWKIAQATGQWTLMDAKARRDAQATFDGQEFDTHLGKAEGVQSLLRHRLKVTGQTGFHIAYEDLQDLDVINGVARFLGTTETLESLDKKLKKQNPSPIEDKVTNFDEMRTVLARKAYTDLDRLPLFEPHRGPHVPSYIAAAESALLYLPIKGGAMPNIPAWLAALDGVDQDELHHRMSQRDLRIWKRKHPGYRSFTVLRHPLQRAHEAFCRYILSVEKGSYIQLRNTLMRRYKVPLPKQGPDADYDRAAHRASFSAFLKFLKGNLSGQTSVRVDAAWCTQSQAIAGFAELNLPHRIILEADLTQELQDMARLVGCKTIPVLADAPEAAPIPLADIYDEEIEALAADAYQRDYINFGFATWA